MAWTPVQIPDPDQFHKIVTTYDRFDWWRTVTDMMAADQYRDCLALPPSTGKTGILLSWWWSLCHQLYGQHLGLRVRGTPLRLCFVVDRRVIVDSAFELALLLQHQLLHHPALAPMSELVQKTCGVKQPLVVTRLRGGLDRQTKNIWLEG